MRSRSVCHQRRTIDSKNLLVPYVPESLRQRNSKRHLPHFIHRGDWDDVLLHQRRGQWQPDLPSLLPHLRQSSVCQFFGEPAVSRRATRHIGRSFSDQARDQYVGVQRAELGMLGRNPEILGTATRATSTTAMIARCDLAMARQRPSCWLSHRPLGPGSPCSLVRVADQAGDLHHHQERCAGVVWYPLEMLHLPARAFP